MATEQLVFAAVERFKDKLAAVGELRRLSKRQHAMLIDAVQEILKLPRQMLEGESSLSEERLKEKR